MQYAPALQPDKKPTLDEVCKRFETRRRRKKLGSRMPKYLCKAAVAVCRDEPLWQVAKVLRVNYNEMKQRAGDSGRMRALPNQSSREFVCPFARA